MLDIACDCRIHIIVRTLFCRKCEFIRIVVTPAHAHSATEFDKAIYPLHAKDIFKFTIRNKRGMQQDTAVIKLFIFRKNEAKGIRTRENNLHPPRSKHIRKQGRPLDKIIEHGHFVYKHIAKPQGLQQLKVVIDISK